MNNNKQLSFLSDEKLLGQTKLLVQKERNINFQILRHLAEIETRKLYLSQGFSSLFDYAVKELGYSGSAAQRRIKAMKLCKEIPEVENRLKSGKLNLTTAFQLQHFLEKTQIKPKKNNQAHFTFKGEGISTSETDIKKIEESILNKNQEDKNFSNSIQEKTVDCSLNENLEESENFKETGSLESIQQTECVKKTQQTLLDKHQENKNITAPVCHLDKTQKIHLMKRIEGKSSREVEKILSQLTNKEVFQKDKVQYVNANKIKMNIIVQEKCLANLEKLKHLLSHKNLNMSYGNLLLTLSEIALEKLDPERRYERRTYKKENRVKKQLKDTSVLSIDKKVSDDFQKQKIKTLKVGRYIPAQIRDYVWARDKSQCTYVCSKTNKKCSSKHLLQIDHIQPFSLGGGHSSKNLRLLCAFHNQYRNRINDNKKLRL